jgi:hypothetical protein
MRVRVVEGEGKETLRLVRHVQRRDFVPRIPLR